MRDSVADSESAAPRSRGWPHSIGIGGRIASESVAGLARITHAHGRFGPIFMLPPARRGITLSGTSMRNRFSRAAAAMRSRRGFGIVKRAAHAGSMGAPPKTSPKHGLSWPPLEAII